MFFMSQKAVSGPTGKTGVMSQIVFKVTGSRTRARE